MEKYLDLFWNSFMGYADWLWYEITHPHWSNFFYWFIGISLIFLILEVVIPWRKDQKVVRRDFWLDGFYMFFNMFIFSLIGFTATSNVVAEAFNDFLGLFGVTNVVATEVASWILPFQILLLFVVDDFLGWSVHNLLHRVPFLWKFHQVHHSVKEMGFAAHLRYHWMENVIYRSIKYLPLAMIGFGISDYILFSTVTIAIGHHNHSNARLPEWVRGAVFGGVVSGVAVGYFDLGTPLVETAIVLGTVGISALLVSPYLKYVFNGPAMHIWHHAKDLPRPHGVNFGLSLSIWDYLFGTAYVPKDGRDIELGFEGDEDFPQDFVGQELYPASRTKKPA